ncbi:gephyrin-like molybdotransferase Glp [Maricaulis sp.]|uniref:molybdopterin molybdotransferase MoeA n=1 Tax=Maricaulis sp. TaxID=1486257 RepID=UPI0026291C77|nr:gephyrin-like molybdotransferase Glp [Maricaulis sp.]
MIPLDDALARISAALDPLDSETVALADCAGRVLVKDLTARLTQPPFAASAMDGYAVHASDLTGETVTLTLAGESAAGHLFEHALEPGTAIRISTGAALPPGANQVVIQENVTLTGDTIRTSQPPRPLAHIRPTGQDFARGDVLLRQGSRITPEAVSLAASAGVADVSVCRRPRIGLLASGDELVEPGKTPGPGQIVNSIAIGLAGLAGQWGGETAYLGIVRDDPADIGRKLDSAKNLDLLVTIGGASVGDHDHFRTVFHERGGALDFGKIAVKPGKPTWFGALDGTPVLGLPGNPVSAFVMARLVLRHALCRLLGQPPATIFARARLAVPLPENGPRETYLRATRNPQTGDVAPVARQDSSVMSALVEADVLIRRPANAPAVEAGERVVTVVLD